jgi:hypothetical protein
VLFKPKGSGYVLYDTPNPGCRHATSLVEGDLLLLLEEENREHPYTLKVLYKDKIGWLERRYLTKVC